MGQMTTTLLFAALTCAMITSSCAGAANGSPGQGGTITGEIVAVDPQPTMTRVTLAPVSDAPGTSSREPVIILVSPRTELLVQRRDGTVQGRAADLAVGVRVQVEHTGTQLRSLPPQYIAVRVRILPGP